MNKLNKFISDYPGPVGLINGIITLSVAWFSQAWLPTLIVFITLTGYVFLVASDHHDKKEKSSPDN